MKIKVCPMEACSNCGGHGLLMDGLDVATCRECGGGGLVPKRDERGRFVKWKEIEYPDQEDE